MFFISLSCTDETLPDVLGFLTSILKAQCVAEVLWKLEENGCSDNDCCVSCQTWWQEPLDTSDRGHSL